MMIDRGPSLEAWAARFEQLRSGWLAQKIGWGQTLFIRQGTVAWMQAWPGKPATVSQPRLADGSTNTKTLPPGTLGDSLHHQLTCELANLILHCRQEVPA